MKQFYNLKDSPYIYETEQGVKFYFSTRLRKEKFAKTYRQNRIEMMKRIFTRYGISCRCTTASDLDTYRRIETNGFYVVFPDREIENISSLSFRMVRT